MIDTSVRVFSKETGLPLVQLDESTSASVDYELLKSAHKYPDGGLYMEAPSGSHYRFTVTKEEFYSVLSVVDGANALALLNIGVRSAEQATEFIARKGLDSLLRNHSKLSDAALESDLAPLHFIEITGFLKPHELASINAADAIRTYALEKSEAAGLWYFSSMTQSVISGDARYEDIKYIGATLLRRHYDLEGLSARLADLAWSNTPLNYDATHLLRVIERRMENGMDTEFGDSLLMLVANYGGDEALKIKNPTALCHAVYSGVSKENAIACLPYADEVFGEVPDADITFSALVNMQKNGIPVSTAIDGIKAGRTVSQIIGLHAGVEAALTDGWL